MADVVKSLLASRKAWIAVLSVLAMAVLAGIGKVTTTQLVDFLKWTTSAWLASIAVEDAAGKMAPVAAPQPAPVTQVVAVDQGASSAPLRALLEVAASPEGANTRACLPLPLLAGRW